MVGATSQAIIASICSESINLVVSFLSFMALVTNLRTIPLKHIAFLIEIYKLPQIDLTFILT
jgi:hypothetical protein